MTETVKEIKLKTPIGENKQLITLQGITTSQINQALKADNPYPARVFLKVEGQEQDIPVFFRIKEGSEWIRPQIKTGSTLQVEGYFSNSDKPDRPSFTAYSHQLLNSQLSQEIEINHAKK